MKFLVAKPLVNVTLRGNPVPYTEAWKYDLNNLLYVSEVNVRPFDIVVAECKFDVYHDAYLEVVSVATKRMSLAEYDGYAGPIKVIDRIATPDERALVARLLKAAAAKDRAGDQLRQALRAATA